MQDSNNGEAEVLGLEHYSELIEQLHFVEMEVDVYTELISDSVKKLRRARQLQRLLRLCLERLSKEAGG